MSASVGAHEVWFESPDVRLEPSAEAFASPFLVQALHGRVELPVDAPLDAEWLANTGELLPIYHRWWGYPEHHPVRCTGEVHLDAPAGRSKGLFFSGGADSLHSLLHVDDGFEALVFIHGFDIAIDAAGRVAPWEKSFRELAEQAGKRAIVVRTNLRKHPLFKPPGFGRTHGGVLAGVAHVLSGELADLFVSSSWPYRRDRPWGSHWDTDALWSSSRISLRHGEPNLSHHEKVVLIAREPLVTRWLRVCPRREGPPGNCSRCEKCLRTMVGLEVGGGLASSTAFDVSEPLALRIDELPAIQWRLSGIWKEFLGEPLSPEIRAAIRRLLRRSRRERFVRPVKRRVKNLWRRARGRPPKRPLRED